MIKIILEIEEGNNKIEYGKIIASRLECNVSEISKNETERERKVANFMHKKIQEDEIVINDCKEPKNIKLVESILEAIKKSI